ncbi:uncharacterized protein PADG_05524 [Paracoccidioides brasiliensis Pb18]|uniref:Argonaute complex, subunit Arb1 n=1 Tax=Paracoccidioides brasiliensis (strain Pb18) TaxID=502780 RepID=C1GE38_PARBD|nr:uncharacterized protein PADG_05524 [Paracoccidioides brasiliensis Pb18]EEH49445.2 hypothetical protein PADG_05524 [Paracoccidioides brasiliensis Pb18]
MSLPFRGKKLQRGSDGEPGEHAHDQTDGQKASSLDATNDRNTDTDEAASGGNIPEQPDGPEDVAEATVAKKKTKKRTKKSRGKSKGTGFEEYITDGPISVAEYEGNKTRYALRLETAIQRFQAKRKISSDRRNIFTKFLSYGGVDVGPKMFEGNDPHDLMDKDAEDILTATAQSSVPANRVDWDVDFEAVAKGFLSSVLPQYIGLETEQLVDMATSTIRNFLNFILLHDVCPEYTENILAARVICDTAKVELWKAQRASCWAPGNFNMACSTLFGGSYYGFYTGDQEWSKEVGAAGMPDDVARKVVKFAVAGAGTYEQAVRFRDLVNEQKLRVTCVNENGFEVIAIILPGSAVRDFYKQYAPDLQPVGKLRAKPWRDPGLPEEDLPPGQVAEENPSQPIEYEFFVEESVLKFCFVGMKVDTSIWELNCGLHYFDTAIAVYCSFHTVLLNESMIGWKKPRDLRSDVVVWANSGRECEDGNRGAEDPEDVVDD